MCRMALEKVHVLLNAGCQVKELLPIIFGKIESPR